MAEKIVLHVHIISRGVAEGEALVTDKPLSFYAGAISNEEGIVRIDDHPLEGKSIKDKVLVYDTDILSTGAAISFYTKWLVFKTAPVALICRKMHNIGGGAAIYCGVPAVDKIQEGLPWEFISTGDWVKVDADQGVVEVTKQA